MPMIVPVYRSKTMTVTLQSFAEKVSEYVTYFSFPLEFETRVVSMDSFNFNIFIIYYLDKYVGKDGKQIYQ